MDDPVEHWYRYDDRVYAGCYLSEVGTEEYYTTGPRLVLSSYRVLKHTPQGVWLETSLFGQEKRWVSKTSQRRFACPTKEQALRSFIARKKKQSKILRKQLERAISAQQLAEQQLQELVNAADADEPDERTGCSSVHGEHRAPSS